jgi:putative tricarboxylic transport membrane protein
VIHLIKKIRDAGPYLIVLGIAGWVYYVADHISFTAIPNQMGPDRWPKMITATLALVSAFEIIRRLLFSAPVIADVEESGLEEELIHPKQTHIAMVFGTIVATIIYIVALERCGFAASTVIYSACLMSLGGFRRPLVIALCACGLTILFMFIFMKLIFVALPLGQGPFARISLALMSLVGVH